MPENEKLTEELLRELQFSDSLDRFIEEHQPAARPGLPNLLRELMEAKNLRRSEVIRRACLNTTFAYQIFAGERGASRNTALQLAFGMGLTLRETQALLYSAGASKLYCKDRRDAILIYCINKRLALEEADDTLYRFGENTVCEG